MKEEAGGMPALHGLGMHAQTTMLRDRSGMIRYIALLRAVMEEPASYRWPT
jgi:hypothetical protein